MKIVIIGSSGFIGSNLLKFLLKNKYDVIGYDIKESSQVQCLKIESIEDIITENVFKNTNIIINCSGSADVNFSYLNPLKDFEKNSYEVFKLLDGIIKYNRKINYINISSGAVYGSLASEKVNEKSQLDPKSIYGFNKLISESICEQFNTIYDIKTTSIRIFSAYGPGLKKQLFWDLFKKASEKKDIELFGSGNDYRDFVYIEDVCSSIEVLISQKFRKHEIFNIASGEKTLISEAVSIFFNLLNKKIDYKFSGNLLKGYPKGQHADISKIIKLGFKPSYSLEKGLSHTIKWMKEQRL